MKACERNKRLLTLQQNFRLLIKWSVFLHFERIVASMIVKCFHLWSTRKMGCWKTNKIFLCSYHSLALFFPLLCTSPSLCFLLVNWPKHIYFFFLMTNTDIRDWIRHHQRWLPWWCLSHSRTKNNHIRLLCIPAAWSLISENPFLCLASSLTWPLEVTWLRRTLVTSDHAHYSTTDGCDMLLISLPACVVTMTF